MHPAYWAAAAIYLIGSATAFLAYGLDKRAARLGRRRTRERTLHLMELLGGWPGAWLARRVFRHKTRDWPFVLWFWVIGGMHAAAWATWLAFNMLSR